MHSYRDHLLCFKSLTGSVRKTFMHRRVLLCFVALSSLILPAFGQKEGEKNRTPLSISAINSAGTETETDLLVAELSSGDHGIAVLERKELSLVADESSLTALSFSKVASASIVLLIESFDTGISRFLATRAVERSTGRILWSDFRKQGGDLQNWIKTIEAGLAEISAPSESAVRVSLQGLHREFEAGSTGPDLEEVALGRMVASELAEANDIVVLERFDLGSIEFERFLTRVEQSDYAKPDFVVTGDFQLEGESGRARMRLLEPENDLPILVEVSSETGDLPSLARKIGKSLSAKIREASRLKPSPQLSQRRLTESSIALDEADRSFRLGLYELAAKQAEVADLIDTSDNSAIDLIRLYANLFSLFPELPGINISNGPFTIFSDKGDGSFLDLWETYQSRKEQYPPEPTAGELRSYRGIIESLSEFVAKLSPENIEDQYGKNRKEIARLHQTIDRFLEELVWATYELIEKDDSGALKHELLLLGQALLHLEQLEANRFPGDYHYPQNLFTLPFLLGSPEEGIAYLDSHLYGERFLGVPELTRTAYKRRQNQFTSYRATLFGFLGLDSEDNNLIVPGQDFSHKPIVGALTGVPMTPQQAIRAVTSSKGDVFDPLREMDAAIAAIKVHQQPGTERDEAFASACDLLDQQSDTLAKKGFLVSYAKILIFMDKNQHFGGGLSSPGEHTLDFWKMIHRKSYKNSPWGESQLSTYLKPDLKYNDFFKEHPDEAVALVDSMLADIEDFNENAEPGAVVSEKNLRRYRDELVEVRDAIPEGLTGIGEEENIEVAFLDYGYWHAPKIRSLFAEKSVFLLQHDVRQPDADARISVFNLTGRKDIQAIDLPPELSDLFFNGDPEPTGDMEVRESSIVVAAPGAVGIYDRKEKTWEIIPNELMKGKKDFRIVGDHVVFQLGASLTSLQTPPVQGLYCFDFVTRKTIPFIDTTRRPSVNLWDSATSLVFPSPIMPLGDRQFIARLHETGKQSAVLRFGFKSTVEGSPPISSSISLPLNPKDDMCGHVLGDLSTVAVVRRLRKPATYTNPTEPFQVIAFSLKPDQEEPTWLLASKAPDNSPGTPISISHQPNYEFPEEFAVTGTSLVLHPVIWHDGTRLLFLSPQLTRDGKRILYYWSAPNSNPPTRIALDFNFLRQYGPEDMSLEERTNREKSATLSIDRITVAGDIMFFDFAYGYYMLPMGVFREHMKKRSLP
ncbi:MAG: hypothetical protein KDN19_07410 [Verrucomicrobiae bacterium]|nr:hypothetical protein [Verrucomicrobiae bacterium]